MEKNEKSPAEAGDGSQSLVSGFLFTLGLGGYGLKRAGSKRNRT